MTVKTNFVHQGIHSFSIILTTFFYYNVIEINKINCLCDDQDAEAHKDISL